MAAIPLISEEFWTNFIQNSHIPPTACFYMAFSEIAGRVQRSENMLGAGRRLGKPRAALLTHPQQLSTPVQPG